MENLDDFEDINFEELENDILQIKGTLVEIEKISADNSVKYLNGILVKTFILNILFLTGLCFLIYFTNFSNLILILPIINFLLLVYFDYDLFKKIYTINPIEIVGNQDANKLKQIIKISQGLYYLSAAFFIVSIFFIGFVVKLLC
ncbi:MAG: hypothetical protein QM535_13185 [Limnohabitans sp.]|nr:hypothetical protein [Limnohabitans sp.]